MSLEFVALDTRTDPDLVRSQVLQHVDNLPGDTGAPLPENDTDEKNYAFFEKGRDLESAYVNHKYTEKERAILKQYESVDYLPPHSKSYRDWITRQPSRLDWDRWILMGVIGFTVGVLGFLLHQLIEILSDLKWERARKMIENDQFAYAWLWVVSFSVLCVFLSASTVVIFRPSAGGSGLPEIIAYLNGTLVRHIFNVKTFIVKFLSCMFAVAAGMPAGPEAPMVHLGALVAAGISQLRSSTLGFRLPFFVRFRNSEDRRNFISAGAAAGVASAFGAPVGGLLFSMEEVSSFWNLKLSWQTFFCCMVATFTTDLFNSAFSAFHYEGNFGLFKAEKYIHFQVKEGIALNIIALIPTVVLGVVGGLTGALFTFMNLKFARARRKLMSGINSAYFRKLVSIAEPCLIMVIMGTISVFLPAAVSCRPYLCDWKQSTNTSCQIAPQLYNERSVEHYTCPKDDVETVVNGTKYINGSFNQVATLLFLTGEKAIHHLFSRDTHLQFDFGPLLVVLPCYFFLACWAAGTPISSGVVVPQLFIGGLLGRLIGISMVSLFGVQSLPFWDWMDPGAFALLGAAAFFGGVSRLTMSLTIIMVELTNDIQFLLLIMVVIMVSKWVGDFLTHPFYHSQLEFKCIPFLDAEPVVTYDGKKRLNLELFVASHVMSSPVITLQTRERVSNLARLLLDTTHCGFPIVKAIGSDVCGAFCGIITRTELSVLLCHREAFQQRSDEEFSDLLNIDFGQFADEDIVKLSQSESFNGILKKLSSESFSTCWIDLIPYANQSAPSVYDDFSLHRTYMIFRSLGLRHLTVVNRTNQVVGMITRKDLMGFSIEEKLDGVLNRIVSTNSFADSS